MRIVGTFRIYGVTYITIPITPLTNKRIQNERKHCCGIFFESINFELAIFLTELTITWYVGDSIERYHFLKFEFEYRNIGNSLCSLNRTIVISKIVF